MFRYLPEQASEIAPKVDWLHHWITDISVFFTVAIVGAMLYFAIRYRKKDNKHHDTPQIKGSHFLEVVWTVVPTIICIFIAYYGVAIFREMKHVPKDALTINVSGQKWLWDFEYPASGKKSTGEFVVPVNKPIKLVLQSRDVLHSFFIPAMRVKSDAIKGYFTYLSFKPVRTGEYHVFCTEYCGKDHSAMRATLRVVSEADYERWVNDTSEKLPPAEKGKALFVKKGCNGCHSLDGSRLVGPSFLKLWGKEEQLEGGANVAVDENYISESILNPNKKIVKGFPANQMPVFEGQLDQKDITALIEFIKTVDESAPIETPKAVQPAVDLSKLTPAERGKRIYDGSAGNVACQTCHSLDGSKIVGPSFKGIYGRSTKMTDGSSVTTDDAYLKESILNPTAKVVEGFAPAMPPFQGVLSDEQISDVIEYLKTVK